MMMGQYVQILLWVITATILLWFGYMLFLRIGIRLPAGKYGFPRRRRKARESGYPGAPQTCPVCSARLDGGELVKSLAFPSLNGGADRFMHIKGCLYCLSGERARVCPVCGHVLSSNEVLVCRMFERRKAIFRRPHVHVLGCSHCRRR